MAIEAIPGKGQIGVDNKLNIAHLRAKNFFGGPEKQIMEHLMRINQVKFNILLISFTKHSLPNELLNIA